MITPKALKIVQDSLGGKAVDLFSQLFKQKEKKVDVIVFLQGDRLDRAKTVLALYRKGLAEKILITGNNELIGRGKRNEENDIHLAKLKNYFLRNGVSKEAIIMDSQSLNTKQQAQRTIKTAKENKWQRMMVVTSPYNILRAFLTFLWQKRKMAWQGEIYMKKADNLSWSSIPSGRKKTAVEMLSVEIEKIKKYKKDITTIKQGLEYIKRRKTS